MYITGGTYLEHIDFYGFKNIYGSAVRAAAATANISDEDVSLVTCSADRYSGTLRSHKDAYGFNLAIQETIDQAIGFWYYHGLDDGELIGFSDTELECILSVSDAAAVLRFGMVEGTAVVSGERVVYDPQSLDPEPFHANGSEADDLALVLNEAEAEAWSGSSGTRKSGNKLLQYPDVETVVIKRGPKGVMVFTDTQTQLVPSYRTDYVWPVGSGDVFSGVFAYYWAVEGEDPVSAANKASVAAAYFCDTRILPIPKCPASENHFTGEKLSTPVNGSSRSQIYIASPFFTLGQRWLVNETRRSLLDMGIDVFSPVHDVGSAQEISKPEEIASSDLKGLRSSDAVLALIDENDSGTHIEIGYARNEDIPVVAYAHQIDERHRTMMEGTGCRIFNHFPTAVYQAVWAT